MPSLRTPVGTPIRPARTPSGVSEYDSSVLRARDVSRLSHLVTAEAPDAEDVPKPPIMWRVCCVELNRDCVQYAVQVLTSFVIIGVSLYQISIKHSDNAVWHTLLGSSAGALMPNPKLSKS